MLMWRNRWRNALIRRRLAVRFRPSTPAVVTLDVKRVVQETETKCDGKTVWGSGHADKAWPPSGPVVQLVRTPACHAGGHRFEPGPGRHLFRGLAQLVARLLWEQDAVGSSPASPTIGNETPKCIHSCDV